MQIIFKANDGTIFYSAEECVQYELELANNAKDWEAWDWECRRTNDTSSAVVVNLDNERAAAQFLAKAKLDEDDRVKGIDEYSQGWYYYDEGASRYIHICEDIVNIFKAISAS
jgi:hypothetical protein